MVDAGPIVGARMRELRLGAGLTLAEVARRMGTHRPIVGRLERGLHDQSIGAIVLYARALGVQPTTITSVLDQLSTLEDGAACVVPEEISGPAITKGPPGLGPSESHAVSSSIVERGCSQ